MTAIGTVAERPAGVITAADTGEDAGHRAGYKALVVGAIGVVYGDIGTSPLYTLREAFGPAGGLHMSEHASWACCRWCSGR